MLEGYHLDNFGWAFAETDSWGVSRGTRLYAVFSLRPFQGCGDAPCHT
jgi:hypothetical protein